MILFKQKRKVAAAVSWLLPMTVVKYFEIVFIFNFLKFKKQLPSSGKVLGSYVARKPRNWPSGCLTIQVL